jgi:MFS family permease
MSTEQFDPHYADPRKAWYAVAVLMVAYTFSFIDRSILSLLVVPIRRDLGISDTGFSLLHGFAFAIFYTALGIPIARLADRHSRKVIVSVGIVIWSVATALCGVARNFGQLFAARVAVGVGEASLSPAAYSMITDMFPRERLGRALGVYNVGVFLGSGLALIIGGAVVASVSDVATVTLPVLGDLRGWQIVFFAVGLPGVLVALLTAALREPVRTGTGSSEQIPLRAVLAFLGRNWKTFCAHFFGFSALTLLFNGLFAWSPTLMIRKFGITGGEAGLYLGVITLLFSTTGIMAGGLLADRLGRAGRADATVRTGLIAACAVGPFAIAAPLMPNLPLTLLMYCPLMFFISFPWAAAAAALQIVSPARMRAQVSAVYLFLVNLAGIGFGPTAIALITDFVFRRDDALPWSLAIIGLASPMLGAGLLWAGLKPFRRSLAAQEAAAA